MPPLKKPKPDPNNPPDDDDDEGDDADIDEKVNKAVNKALAGQLSRKLGPAIEAALKPVLARLTEKPKPDDDDDQDDDSGDDDDDGDGDGDPPMPTKKPKPGKAPAPDPQVRKLNRKLVEMDRQLKEEKEQRQKVESARKNALVDTELTRSLTELGVDKNRLRGALAVHRGSASVVDDEESGQPRVIFKVKRDGLEDELAPAEALKEWADTDEGKSYLAPTGSTGGAGTRPPKPAGPGKKPVAGTPEAKAQRVAEAKTNLLANVSSLVGGGSVAIE